MKNIHAVSDVIISLAISIILISGCGEDAEPETPANISDSETVDTLTIAVNDTIGIEMGGILAYDSDPMDYPKIYSFQLPGVGADI